MYRNSFLRISKQFLLKNSISWHGVKFIWFCALCCVIVSIKNVNNQQLQEQNYFTENFALSSISITLKQMIWTVCVQIWKWKHQNAKFVNIGKKHRLIGIYWLWICKFTEMLPINYEHEHIPCVSLHSVLIKYLQLSSHIAFIKRFSNYDGNLFNDLSKFDILILRISSKSHTKWFCLRMLNIFKINCGV